MKKLTSLLVFGAMAIQTALPVVALAIETEDGVRNQLKETVSAIYDTRSQVFTTKIKVNETTPFKQSWFDDTSSSTTYKHSTTFYTVDVTHNQENEDTSIIYRMDETGKTPLSITLELRLVDDVLYFKVNEIIDGTLKNSTATTSEALSSFTNQWISIPLYGKNSSANSFYYNNVVDRATKSNLTNEVEEKIMQAIVSSKALKVKLVADSTDPNLSHIRISIVKKYIPSLMSEILEVVGQPKLSAKEASKMRLSLLKTKMPIINVWINTQTDLPTKMTVKSGWNTIKEIPSFDKKYTRTIGSRGTYLATVTWSSWDAPITVSKPTKSKGLMEFIEEYFSKF